MAGDENIVVSIKKIDFILLNLKKESVKCTTGLRKQKLKLTLNILEQIITSKKLRLERLIVFWVVTLSISFPSI